MLRRLWARLFGGENQEPPAARQNRPPEDASVNGNTPTHDETPTNKAATDFLRREPILNRKQAVRGYELSLQGTHRERRHHPAAQRFLDGALLDRLVGLDLASILGRRLAFLPLHPLSLDLPQVTNLPRENLIVRLLPDNLTQEQGTQILARMRSLQETGLRLACAGEMVGGPLAPLLEGADFLAVDVAACDPADLLQRQRSLAKAYPHARLIARNVDTQETLQACRAMVFHYFQGGYVTHQRDWPQPRADSSRIVVAQLIGQLRGNPEDFRQLALTARLDPILAFRLLRYINSAAMGLRYKIASLERAMAYVGREGLYRWLTLLLFHTGRNEPQDEAVRETALVRGRLIELLTQGRLSREQAEMAFIAGMLSLTDILFRMPLAQALAQLSLPDEVQDALLRRQGPLGDYLGLAIACEEGEQSEIAELAARCGLDPALVSARHLEAVSWAVQFSENLRADSPL